MSRRRVWLALAALAVIAAIFGGSALWRARDALRAAREHVAGESSFAFSAKPIIPVLPSGLEAVGSPAVFHDAVVFQDHLYIAGPSGLAKYKGASLVARFRPGADLPAAPITSLAFGLAGDSKSPELFIGTLGEGLAAYDGRAFRHIRAEAAPLRKI